MEVESKGSVDHSGKDNHRPTVVRHLRVMDPLFLSLAAVCVGVLSYLGTVSERNTTARKAELREVEVRGREYTNARVDLLGSSFKTLQEYSRETNKRQDEQIEYVRKLWIQVTK